MTAPQGLSEQELATAIPKSVNWIWHGFLAAGNMTLLTGLWKAGKTTLLSLLLSQRKPTCNDAAVCGLAHSLAGLQVKPGKTIIVSEESSSLWADRIRRHDFGGQTYFFPQPFVRIPSPDEWQALIDRILKLKNDHGYDLLVIDPLAPFLKGESNARNILDVLMPLSVLTRQGMGVLATHHPARGKKPLGEAGRGSGALLAHVDISIELRHPGADPLTRRRFLFALSRHEATPRHLHVELNPDATDYLVITENRLDGFEAGWPVLSNLFEDAAQKLTRIDILNEWPEDYDKPSATTLRTWLDHLVKNSLVACEGTGRRGDPFRYWFPRCEEIWKQDPLYGLFEMQREATKHSYQSFSERKRSLAEDARLPTSSLEDDSNETEA
jgi:hypothetical protein